MQNTHTIPRILISGLSGGSGKTFVSLGLSHAWVKSGKQVVPFKKGPDYIDAAWLGLATSHPCYCLDPFFLNEQELREHFIHCMTHNEYNGSDISPIALIEGNRGLFDGKDVEGSCSSARLAHIIDCPVIVSINCTKMTRTVAALVMGIRHFDPSLNLAGVILNNTGSERHTNLVQKAVEMYTDVPVLGVLPRMRNNPIPERHMGLHLHKKNSQTQLLDGLAQFLSDHVDIEKITQIACATSSLNDEQKTAPSAENVSTSIENIEQEEVDALGLKGRRKEEACDKNRVNIAYIYDDALWFYYQENLDALRNAGANLIPLSLLDETPLKEQAEKYALSIRSEGADVSRGAGELPFDALYIGGGFPELYAEEISKSKHLASIKELIENSMPVYAECGGFMILSKQLHITTNNVKNSYGMANIFPIETEFFKKPQGLGYITAETKRENPYHPLGSSWNGHEFHFSKAVNNIEIPPYVLTLDPGHGMQKIEKCGADGLLYKQCFASYAHLFAPAVPHWQKNFIQAALAFKENKEHVASLIE